MLNSKRQSSRKTPRSRRFSMSAALVSGWSRNWRGKPLCGSLSRRNGRSVPSDWANWCHDAGVGRNRREGVGRACSANALRSPPRAAEARPGIDRRQSGARARWPSPEHLSGSSARRPRWSPRKGARSRLSCHRFRPRDRVSTFNNVSASVPRPSSRPLREAAYAKEARNRLVRHLLGLAPGDSDNLQQVFVQAEQLLPFAVDGDNQSRELAEPPGCMDESGHAPCPRSSADDDSLARCFPYTTPKMAG